MEPRNAANPTGASPEKQRILEEIANLQMKRLSLSPRDQAALDQRVHELMDQLRDLDNPAPTPVAAAPAPEPVAEPRSEIERLRAKLASTADPDLRAGLELQIERLLGTTGPVAGAVEAPVAKAKQEEDEPLPEPPTPQQVMEAENLLRQAKVAQMRNQKSEARRLIERAAQVAPGSVAVLEVLGDELAAAGQYRQARDLYKRALRIDPKNASIERKYGHLVLRTENSMSVEAMLMAGDKAYVAPSDVSPKAATILSLFVPGCGQLVLGEAKKGIVMFLVWLFSMGWILLQFKDFASMFAYMQNPRGVHVNWIILLPTLAAGFVHITSVAECALKAKEPAPKRKIDRPRPPSDLPFE